MNYKFGDGAATLTPDSGMLQRVGGAVELRDDQTVALALGQLAKRYNLKGPCSWYAVDKHWQLKCENRFLIFWDMPRDGCEMPPGPCVKIIGVPGISKLAEREALDLTLWKTA